MLFGLMTTRLNKRYDLSANIFETKRAIDEHENIFKKITKLYTDSPKIWRTSADKRTGLRNDLVTFVEQTTAALQTTNVIFIDVIYLSK